MFIHAPAHALLLQRYSFLQHEATPHALNFVKNKKATCFYFVNTVSDYACFVNIFRRKNASKPMFLERWHFGPQNTGNSLKSSRC